MSSTNTNTNTAILPTLAAAQGQQVTLTYCIPRVHSSVTKEFMERQLFEFWNKQYGMVGPLPEWFYVVRIDLVEIPDNEHFYKAFVYHRTVLETPLDIAKSSEALKLIEASATEGKQQTSGFQVAQQRAQKVYFNNNGRTNYWILLPNNNPLTGEQLLITQRMKHLSTEILDNLMTLCLAGKPINNSWPLEVLDAERIDTTKLTIEQSTAQLHKRVALYEWLEKCVREACEQAHLPISSDYDFMERLEQEQAEECEQAREDDRLLIDTIAEYEHCDFIDTVRV
jgi:hypothetical protein